MQRTPRTQSIIDDIVEVVELSTREDANEKIRDWRKEKTQHFHLGFLSRGRCTQPREHRRSRYQGQECQEAQLGRAQSQNAVGQMTFFHWVGKNMSNVQAKLQTQTSSSGEEGRTQKRENENVEQQSRELKEESKEAQSRARLDERKDDVGFFWNHRRHQRKGAGPVALSLRPLRIRHPESVRYRLMR